MKRASLILLVLTAALCIATMPAAAGTIFDDFGPANSYNCCTGWTVSGPGSPPGQFIAANLFTAGASGSVGQIDLAIGLVTGDGSGTAALYTDNNGVPGTLLGSWGFTAHQPFGGCCAIETIMINGGPTLTSGTDYFMVLSADDITWDAWNLNTVGATGLDLFSTDNGNSWNSNGIQTLGTFRILTGAVPEPGTLVLLGSGLLAAAGAFRRKLKV
ncbi:MAG: choice-of-anchor R domain-containing protein [Terriglobales bacterium]